MGLAAFPRIVSDAVSVHSVAMPWDGAIGTESRASGLALPERLQKAASKRQQEFLAGRYCAMQAFRQAGFPDPPSIGIGEDRAPLWPAGWVGSISHTQGLASAAVAPAARLRGLGIDSEPVMSQRTAEEVFKAILTPEEIERWWKGGECLGNGTLEARVSLIFSAKESLYKCLRPLVGAFFGFQAAEVMEVDPRQGNYRISLKADIGAGFGPGWFAVGRFAYSEGLIHTAIEY